MAATATGCMQSVGAGVSAAQQPATQERAKIQTASKTPSPFAEAELLFQQGSLEEAKNKSLELLKRYPSDPVGYKLLGIIYSEQKDYANALGAFEQALTLDPKSAGLHNNLGNVYLAQGNVTLAEKEFRKALTADPTNRDGNYNLALVLMGNGKSGEAILHFLRVRPPDMATRLNLSKAYLQAGKTPEGLQVAREISASNKEDVQLHLGLGVMLATEKQWSASQLELEKANALKPETFEILYNLGQAYLRGAQTAKAELILNRALKLKPDSPETLYLLAMVYQEQKRAVDALDLLVRAHKLAPENTDVIFLLARVSMSQNYFEDAIPLLESALATAPQRSDLRAALGESYFMAGKVDKAIEEFQKLIQADPSARSYVFLGISYRHLGRFDEAKQYFQQGLKLDPHNSACLFNLGFIAERQGDTAGAEALFQQALRANPDYADALLELANLRIIAKKYPEAAQLLRKYVQVSHTPATGYYKLAMVERNLHDMEAADRDLKVFQTLSKDAPAGPYPYEHLFEYLDNRSKLAPQAQTQSDISQLSDDIKKHPDQPEDLYLLAEAYLKSGKVAEAKETITQLDKISSGDYRTQTGVGVLLARYRLYDDAIQHFRSALEANPKSDEVKFDIADAYFRKGQYPEALDAANQVSEQGRKDEAYLSLLGDIYAHLGDAARATQVYEDAIARNPDNDQDYLSLALLQLRENSIDAAKQTLLKGQARVPGSGKILWGLGIVSAMEGNTVQAADRLSRAVDLLPEWSGSYSALGIFYYQTGQISKAREVLNRFKNSNASGAFDVNRIEQALAQAPDVPSAGNQPMSMAGRKQLLQVALALADRTL
jgi:tetratricopeptide (TPR) repeat protein